MKKWLIVLMLTFLCSGCFEDLSTTVNALSASVDALQLSTTQLVKDNVISQEKADKINENIDKIQEDVKSVNEAVATASDPVEAIEKGWSASEPFNPYYGYGAAIIAALKVFQLGKQKKESETKYAAAKIGMDKFRNDNPDKARELYEDVGEARKAKKVT